MTSNYHGVDNLDRMATLAPRYNACLVRLVERHCGQSRQLVDFGAGTGTFACTLQQRGYHVTCVEPDPPLHEMLRGKGLTVVASLDELAPDSLPAVFSLNVIEHIDDDAAALRDIYRHLEPGGVLYLFVPAFGILFSSMDRKVGHLRRYTRPMLTDRLRQCGFEVQYACYADCLEFLVTLLFKLVGNRRGDLNPVALRFYDAVVFPLSCVLDRVAGRFIGKNLSVRAIRPAGPSVP